ncbi:MAG: flagellar basal body P-ring formation chaperone FlgA [Xanthobacteraceae bacterium]|jgi:flagella basal body P-ring formation protein FlgA
MIRSPIRYLALALLLAGLPADPGAAQNAMPALRANVTVTGEIVRIGDLIENCGPVADVPIFRAPDLGTRGAVPTERVIEAIRPHQLIGIDTRGITEVVVTRASRAITAQDIAARVAKALESQYGLGDARNIAVEFDRDVRTLNVEPTVTGELQVASLSYNRRAARFDVTFDLPGSAALRWQSMRYSGTAMETVDALGVDHPVERGEVLKASDLTIIKRPKSEGAVLTDAASAAGLAARHQLRPGQPLHDADLMKPQLVQRNDSVTIIYEAPGVTLTLRGQAQDNGALGDTVSVQNVQSKRLVQGVVSGPGRVTIIATPARVVGAEPPPAPEPSPSDQPQREHSVE